MVNYQIVILIVECEQQGIFMKKYKQKRKNEMKILTLAENIEGKLARGNHR